MEKLGDSYYQSDGVAVNEIESPSLVTGSLEQSNVDIMLELVEMISVQKSFEANQKMIHTSNSTLEKLISNVSRGIS